MPAGNADGSTPADLAYVDVYAATGKPEGPLGRALTLREMEALLTHVGRVEVQPPPPPEEEVKPPRQAISAQPPAAPAPAAPVDPRPAQGAVVRVEETLTDALRTTIFEHPDAAKVAKHPRCRRRRRGRCAGAFDRGHRAASSSGRSR